MDVEEINADLYCIAKRASDIEDPLDRRIFLNKHLIELIDRAGEPLPYAPAEGEELVTNLDFTKARRNAKNLHQPKQTDKTQIHLLLGAFVDAHIPRPYGAAVRSSIELNSWQKNAKDYMEVQKNITGFFSSSKEENDAFGAAVRFYILYAVKQRKLVDDMNEAYEKGETSLYDINFVDFQKYRTYVMVYLSSILVGLSAEAERERAIEKNAAIEIYYIRAGSIDPQRLKIFLQRVIAADNISEEGNVASRSCRICENAASKPSGKIIKCMVNSDKLKQTKSSEGVSVNTVICNNCGVIYDALYMLLFLPVLVTNTIRGILKEKKYTLNQLLGTYGENLMVKVKNAFRELNKRAAHLVIVTLSKEAATGYMANYVNFGISHTDPIYNPMNLKYTITDYLFQQGSS